MIRTILLGAALTFVSAFSALAITNTVNAADTRGCNDNSIIRCGTLNQSELREKLRANNPSDLDNIYAHYGLPASTIYNTSAVWGTLYKNGEVKVDGKVVATGAETVGRQYLNGSKSVTIDGKKYWQRSTSVSLRGNSEKVMVYLNEHGQFKGAVIPYCGNPVVATNKVPKPPEPKPKQVLTCDELTSRKISRDTYEFTVEATATNGATIRDYTYEFGDDNEETSSATTLTHQYDEPGDYTTTVTVNGTLNGKATSVTAASCKVMITVEEEPVEPCPYDDSLPVDSPDCVKGKEYEKVCDVDTKEIITVEKGAEGNYAPVDSELCEEKEEEVPAVIPDTGPTEWIFSALGLGALSAGGYYYNHSRRSLLGTLLNK